MNDEELARVQICISDSELQKLQNEFDEQASLNLLRSGRRSYIMSHDLVTEDNHYIPSHPSTSYHSYSSRPSRSQPTESSLGKTVSKTAKSLKNKFINFFHERSGYKRVNTTDDGEGNNSFAFSFHRHLYRAQVII